MDVRSVVAAGLGGAAVAGLVAEPLLASDNELGQIAGAGVGAVGIVGSIGFIASHAPVTTGLARNAVAIGSITAAALGITAGELVSDIHVSSDLLERSGIGKPISQAPGVPHFGGN